MIDNLENLKYEELETLEADLYRDLNAVRKRKDELVEVDYTGKYILFDNNSVYMHVCSQKNIFKNDLRTLQLFGEIFYSGYDDDLSYFNSEKASYDIEYAKLRDMISTNDIKEISKYEFIGAFSRIMEQHKEYVIKSLE